MYHCSFSLVTVLSVLLTTYITSLLSSNVFNLSFASCLSFFNRWSLAFSLRSFGYEILIGRFSNRSCADGRIYIYTIFIILINQLSDVFAFSIVVEQQYYFLKIFPNVSQKSLKKMFIEKDRKHNSLTILCEPMRSRRSRSSCSTSDIRRVTLVTNPVIRHEWGHDLDCDYDKHNLFEIIW